MQVTHTGSRVTAVLVWMSLSTALFLPLEPTAHGAQGESVATNVSTGLVRVTSSGKPVERASVTLTVFATDGSIWRESFLGNTDTKGQLAVPEEQLRGIVGPFAGSVTVEAPWHVTATEIFMVGPKTDGKEVALWPSVIAVSMDPVQPFLLLLFLVPAVAMLIPAVWHLRKVEYASIRGGQRQFSLGVCLVWGLTVSSMAGTYFESGAHLIPLFFDNILVSSGVVVFAFLGSMVYAAFSIFNRNPEFFSEASAIQHRRMNLTLGGRILVAPYVAVVAFVVLGATFPTLHSDGMGLFFGFFTGLFIKPVIDMLNKVGMSLLSAESVKKVTNRLTSTTPPAGAGSRTVAKPSRAFLDTVAQARKELLEKDGVIGIDAVGRPTPTDGQRSLIAYVLSDQDRSIAGKGALPTVYKGYNVEVQELPLPDADAACHSVLSTLSWRKVADIANARAGATFPTDQIIQGQNGEFLIMVVDPSKYFVETRGVVSQTVFNVFDAYRNCSGDLGADPDFVAFLLDEESSGVPAIRRDHYIPVRSRFSGTDHDRFAHITSGDWNSGELTSIQVHRTIKPDLSRLLHELGHNWAAYLMFDPDGPLDIELNLIDGSGCHWHRHVLSSRSCMSEWVGRRLIWENTGGGTFTRHHIEAAEFSYSELDLYLMGVLPAGALRDIEILGNVEQIDASNQFRANVHRFSVQDIQRTSGNVDLLSQAKEFHQTFVVVTDDISRVAKINATVPALIRNHRDNFQRAVRASGVAGAIDVSLKTTMT